MLVGSVTVQQDQERFAGPLRLRLGPLDDRGGEGIGVSHGAILTARLGRERPPGARGRGAFPGLRGISWGDTS